MGLVPRHIRKALILDRLLAWRDSDDPVNLGYDTLAERADYLIEIAVREMQTPDPGPVQPLLDLTDPGVYELVCKSLAATNTEDLINVIHVALRDHPDVSQADPEDEDDRDTATFDFEISHPESTDPTRPARVTVWSDTSVYDYTAKDRFNEVNEFGETSWVD